MKFMHCISRYYGNRAVIIAFMAIWGIACSLAYGSERRESCGPRIALLGDSMTWIGGDSCQNPTSWSHYLKESGIAGGIDMYARSGATWTNTCNTKADADFYSEILNDDNVVYNQTLRLIKEADADIMHTPDVIVIFAGANDAWFCDKRPGIFDNVLPSLDTYDKDTDPASVTSLAGCVSLTCYLLKDIFPDSKIVLVTPLEMSKAPAGMTARVADAIESAGIACRVMTLRADREVAIRHQEEKKKPHYTYDGVHTNPEGARMLGQYIIENLKSLIR